ACRFVLLCRLLALCIALSLVLELADTAFAAQAVADSIHIDADADADLDAKQLMKKRGYLVEEHKVITADRYILTMFRLPKSYDETQRNVSAAPNKPVVYLIHGVLDSSITFAVNFRTQSLAYLLADAGYDVWLGNNRGTPYSREHLEYTTADAAFWDFSFEDMAEYDLPAMINHVLDVSKRPTLSYIGHSAGTMQAFAGFSLNQDVARRVSYFGALAPVAYTGGTTSPVFRALAKIYFDKLSSLFGGTEFLGSSPVVEGVVKYGCALADVACDSLITAFMGPSANLNQSRAHVYLSHMPTSTSVKNVGHFAQGIRGNAFRRFDYGCVCATGTPVSLCPTALCKNKAVYGALKPPAFDLSRMKYPRTALFTGRNDWLSTASDVAKLRKELPAGTVLSETSVPYNHVDFTWASNTGELLNKDLLAQIRQYEGQGYN
ncbi:hypothetical protein PybrP1_001772, partial [[Pythium] brassicae (nom. inval.)]